MTLWKSIFPLVQLLIFDVLEDKMKREQLIEEVETKCSAKLVVPS
jgi:predicted transposase YdaD